MTTAGDSPLEFTNRWFDDNARPFWERLIPGLEIAKALEIGSYEGASACFLIAAVAYRAPLSLHCVDTWAGGVEHAPDGLAPADMEAVERRFCRNIATAVAAAPHPVDLHVHRAESADALAGLLAGGHAGTFDFIYVDGSHQAPDVLADAVLAFRLLKVGGHLVFDDYLWAEALPGGVDPLRCPKPAIDAFTTLYCRKLQILHAPLYQLYVRKLAD